MKILFFVNDLFGNDGYSRYSLDLINAFKDSGLEIICLVYRKNENISYIKQYEVLRGSIKYLNNPFLLLVDFMGIRRVIKRENPSLIHFMVEAYALIMPFIYNSKIKYFLTIHGTYALVPLKKFFIKFLVEWYYKKINKIISVSHYTKKRLTQLKPELEYKISAVHNGIDLSNSLFCNPNNKIKSIVFLGEVKKRKGILEAIDSLGAYSKKYGNNFLFSIMGLFDKNDNYFIELEKKIIDYHLENNIKFLGVVSESRKIEILKNADLYLMLSKVCGDYFEGFGLAYLEANKYGVPVIGPNDGGPKEAIKDGYSGYIVNISDSEGVAEKINEVLNNNSIKRENCLEWARENNIIPRAREIKKLYEKLLIDHE